MTNCSKSRVTKRSSSHRGDPLSRIEKQFMWFHYCHPDVEAAEARKDAIPRVLKSRNEPWHQTFGFIVPPRGFKVSSLCELAQCCCLARFGNQLGSVGFERWSYGIFLRFFKADGPPKAAPFMSCHISLRRLQISPLISFSGSKPRTESQ